MSRRPLLLALAALLAACDGPPSSRSEPDGGTLRAVDPCVEGPVFVDAAAEAGLAFRHWNGMTGRHYLTEITGSGVAVFDYDRDDDLDVYLVQGSLLAPGETAAEALEEPPGELPPKDRLFRNDSSIGEDGRRVLRFTDVTEEAGLEATGYGMGVAVGDYDADGWPDLYLTNVGSNQLWRNAGDGTFREVTTAAGVDDRSWSVPAVFFDFDGDGFLDLFVGNYVRFSLGSHRECVTASGAPDYCGPLSYSPTPDRLFRNRGDGTFSDVTGAAGLAGVETNALGAVAADFDADGRLDLYVASDQLANILWMNRGEGRFRDHALFAGAALSGEGLPQASMGVDAADFDEDGDLDLFLSHLSDEASTLYRNDGAGNFVDSSVASGVGMASWPHTGWGTGWIDFDHDGRLDLLTANGAVRKIPAQMQAGIEYPLRQPMQLLRNLGGGRFEDATALGGPVLEAPAVGRGVAFGDLDEDGDTDAVVNESNGAARLLVNTCGQDREWIGFDVVGRDGRPAVGAEVTLELEGGERLLRRVHRDGSYASSSDPRVVVGLHGRSPPAAAVVRWPAGGAERFSDLAAGRYHALVEGEGEIVPGEAEP